MRAARVLVVDDDPWIQRRIASTLGQRGHQVSLAGDGQGALVVASKVRPDLIITDVALPTIDGWSWWERLRASPPAADTPVLFLVSVVEPTTEIRGQGAHDVILRKPFRVEDLEKTVVQMLGGDLLQSPTHPPTPSLPPRPPRAVDPTKPSAGYRPLSAIRGALDQIGLPGVLTLLEMERKTGLLLLERPPHVARLHLRRGRIVRAGVEDPPLSGVAAVYEVLSWNEGAFDFLTGDVGGVDEIQTATTYLLMEGARRLDEANEKRRADAQGRKL